MSVKGFEEIAAKAASGDLDASAGSGKVLSVLRVEPLRKPARKRQ